MHPELRARFNAGFTSDKYETLLRCVNETEKWPADFRISETPIFLTDAFTDELTNAATTMVDRVRTPEFARHAENAIPAAWNWRTRQRTHFFVVDFGVCEMMSG